MWGRVVVQVSGRKYWLWRTVDKQGVVLDEILQLKRIRRGSYTSVGDLETAIYDYLPQHNASPKPFAWTKTANDILTRERPAINALDEIRGSGNR